MMKAEIKISESIYLSLPSTLTYHNGKRMIRVFVNANMSQFLDNGQPITLINKVNGSLVEKQQGWTEIVEKKGDHYVLSIQSRRKV